MFTIVKMTQYSLWTAVTPGKMKKIIYLWCKSLRFPTKWYRTLCKLVDPVLRIYFINSNYQYLKKKLSKNTLVLKGLKHILRTKIS